MLIKPVLGSSNSIQPNVVASGGKINEIRKPNSSAFEKKMLVRDSNHAINMPSGSAMTCRTTPIFTLFHKDRQIPASLKASFQACSP